MKTAARDSRNGNGTHDLVVETIFLNITGFLSSSGNLEERQRY
jgi:hypothetical protein